MGRYSDRDLDIRNAEDGRPPRPAPGPIQWGPEERVLPAGAYTTGYAEGGEPEQDSEERAFVTRYNRAELAILSIEEEVGRLEKRLELVLLPANAVITQAEPADPTEAKEHRHSEALRRVETLERQALMVTRRVQNLTERVDL